MQYALWLLVLVRLLVPVNVGTLAHNVLSAAEPVQAVVEERLDTPVLYVQDGTERRPAQLLPGKESQGEPLSPPSDAAQIAPCRRIFPRDTDLPNRHALRSAHLHLVRRNGRRGRVVPFHQPALRRAQGAHTLPRRGCRYRSISCPRFPPRACSVVLRPAVYLNEKALQSPDAPALRARARADARAAP